MRQPTDVTRLVHAVAAEALVVHGHDGLVHNHVGLEARLERHGVRESFGNGAQMDGGGGEGKGVLSIIPTPCMAVGYLFL